MTDPIPINVRRYMAVCKTFPNQIVTGWRVWQALKKNQLFNTPRDAKRALKEYATPLGRDTSLRGNPMKYRVHDANWEPGEKGSKKTVSYGRVCYTHAAGSSIKYD